MLALLRAKFACNSAIRYSVFRWKSYKDCVWESVKNSSVCAIKSTLVTDDSPKYHTCEACRKLKGHDSWSTIGQKGQFGQSVILRLKLATCPSHKWVTRNPCFAEKWLFTFLTCPTINTFIPTKCREFPKRFLREEPQRTIRLIHPQSYTFDFSNSPTLTLSIDKPLRGALAKSYLIIFISMRRLFDAWETIQR